MRLSRNVLVMMLPLTVLLVAAAGCGKEKEVNSYSAEWKTVATASGAGAGQSEPLELTSSQGIVRWHIENAEYYPTAGLSLVGADGTVLAVSEPAVGVGEWQVKGPAVVHVVAAGEAAWIVELLQQ